MIWLTLLTITFPLISGTSPDFETQTSLANMLLQYNPDLIGGSTSSNSVIFPGSEAGKGLNLAVSGAWAKNAPAQAETLVAAIKYARMLCSPAMYLYYLQLKV